MSQAGNFSEGAPTIPGIETLTGNTGGAVPGSGSPVNVNIIGGSGVTVTGNPGTSTLTIDLNGGGVAIDSIAVQTGTSPVVPSGTGLVTMNGAVVAAGTNPIRTDGTGANTLAVEVQISQALAATDATKIGLANFDSSSFSVDANGFVTASSTGLFKTITGNTGGPESPLLGNFNVLGTGSITVAGSANTETIQLTGLTNHNVLVGAGTATITNVSPSTSGFVLTSNGAAADPSFQAVSASGAATSFTGNTGGPEVPLLGNFNIVGTGSITVAGSANTETVQLTGLTNHSILVGAGTATITNLGVATNGQLPIGSTGADPVLATLTAGTNVVITNGAGSISIAANTQSQTLNLVSVTTTPYVVLSTDYFLAVSTSGGSKTIQLPNAPATGRVFVVKDSTGNAASNNIIVTTVGGAVNIDGSTTYTINTAYSSIELIFDGVSYQVF